MNIKDINWNQVTGLSQVVAIILFVGVFALGFFLGVLYEFHAFVNAMNAGGTPAPTAQEATADVTYACKKGTSIQAVYHEGKVDLFLPDQRHIVLPQVIAASGARYANPDESFVFWNKGETAFITEGKTTTYEDCVVKPLPQ